MSDIRSSYHIGYSLVLPLCSCLHIAIAKFEDVWLVNDCITIFFNAETKQMYVIKYVGFQEDLRYDMSV
jgi:hypothetical protein